MMLLRIFVAREYCSYVYIGINAVCKDTGVLVIYLARFSDIKDQMRDKALLWNAPAIVEPVS